MNAEILNSKCAVLEKIIISIADIYNHPETTSEQKALMETIIGAAIWYLPNDESLFAGGISMEALQRVTSGTPISKLTKEHRFPRKQAGRILLSEKYRDLQTGQSRLVDLYLNEF